MDGKLYHHRLNNLINPLIEDLDAWKLVFPMEFRKEALEKSQDVPDPFRKRTFCLLSRYYYWPVFRKNIIIVGGWIFNLKKRIWL